MGRMLRTALSVTILAAVIGWIVLSYLPTSIVTANQFVYSASGVMHIFPEALLMGLLLFVALQLWLVQTTTVTIRAFNADVERRQAHSFRLSVPKELILTALPIGFTLLLAVASYDWWQRLVALP